jgi:hypothetical protein
MRGSKWGRRRVPDVAIAAGLVVAVLLAFSAVFRNGFVNFDDPLYITENQVTQRGLSVSTVVWAFVTDSAANWHPLTWLSVMLDIDLFGLHPAGHHAMSLGLHGLNTVLVFVFMRRLGVGRGASAFAAGFFGLHPLHVESVAWAAERKDVLSMAFGLLTLLAYLRYAESPSRGRMAWVTGLFVLGLMAKPTLVTLPFVLLLLDWWPLRRVGSPAWIASPEVGPDETVGVPWIATGERMGTTGFRHPSKGWTDRGNPDECHTRADPGTPFESVHAPDQRAAPARRLLLEKVPLFLLVVLSCVVTYLAQKAGKVVMQGLTFAARLENSVHAYVAYLKKLAFPSRLACFYPITDLGAGRVALSAAILAVATLIAWRLRRTQPYFLVGWLWFLGSLVPMIGIVQVGGQAYADRYTYFPSLGIGFAASLCLAEAVGRTRLPRPAVMLAGSALLIALGVATWRQTLVWRNTVGLFEHAIVATGRNPFIRLQLAEEFVKNNEFQRAEAMVQQSLADGGTRHDQLMAVDLLMSVQTAISLFYDREHREDDALRQIDTALVVQPNDWELLVDRGFFLAKLQRDAEAVAVLEKAIALETGNNPQQLEIARHTLAAARRRLAVGEGPEGGSAAPR